jgi:hypothetical protein
MKKAPILALALLSAMTAQALAQQPAYLKAGTLRCRMSGDVGFIIGSRQILVCNFAPNGGPPEAYVGSITTLGLDVGVTAGGVMGWAVLLTTKDPFPGALVGSYVGASGDVALGLGAGANVLVGGSNRSVALQPVSIEGQVGVSLALGVSDLRLNLAP